MQTSVQVTNHNLTFYLDEIAAWMAALPTGSHEVVVLHFKDFTGTWDDTAYSTLFNTIQNVSLRQLS